MTEPSQTVPDLVRAFLAHEEQAGLWELQAYGQRYWHNVRWNVWTATQQALGLSGPKQATWRDRSWTTWLKPRSGHFTAMLRRSSWVDLASADMLVFNHPRHVRDEGHWHCAYSDPLLRDLPLSRIVIEQGFQGQHYHPNRTEGLKYIEWAKWKAYAEFAVRDSWRGGRLSRDDTHAVRAWAAALRDQLGGGPSDEHALDLVRIAIRRKVALGRIFEHLLDRVRPKVIIHVVHYNFRSLVITPLARARGIPVIELQHGFIGPSHLAYNVAPGRYPEAYPDYVLTFGRMWRDNTPGLPLPPERTPAVGFARLESMYRSRRHRPKSGPKTVLFVSARAYGEPLSQIAVALQARINADQFRIVYKLHPNEMGDWRQRYSCLDASDVCVAADHGDDIYDLFSRSHVLVGVYSTALFEGLAFGLHTLVMALPGHEDMDVLISRGLASLVADADALAEHLSRTPAKPSTDALEAIWQPNAQVRFRTFLENLLDG